MAKSIRLRLLGWNAALLLGVVGGFASMLYWQVRGARLHDIDAQLEASAAGLESALRFFPPHELLGEEAPPEIGPPDRRPGPREAWPPPHPRTRSPEERLAEDGPPNRARLFGSLNLPGPPGMVERPYYFAIWRADGSLLKATELPPNTSMPVTPSPGTIRRTRAPNREAFVLGPRRTVVLVGTPIGPIASEMKTFAWQLVATGAAVVGMGLAGVWVISRRVFRPVDAIAVAASRISADDLSGRIDTNSIDAELVGLAKVLNETFERLASAFERQARFTADASHELRTPLAIVRSRAELALARPRTPEEYREAMESCLKATDRMTGLVDCLLTLARAEAGCLDVKHATVDLHLVVEEAIDLLRGNAEAKRLEFNANLSPMEIIGDAESLTRLVMNLLANAIQYSHVGGKVEVALADTGSEIVLAVADNGIGIPEVDRDRVFERFYRADKARSRASGGSGLGLAICKSIVEAHRGTITFLPTAEGGSTFRVSFPRLFKPVRG
jgi:two-component system, OmpR family, sensor kinase